MEGENGLRESGPCAGGSRDRERARHGRGRARGNGRSWVAFYAQGGGCAGTPNSLVGSLTRPALECIDALANGCDDETSFWLTRLGAGKSILTGEMRAGHDGSNCEIDLLGRARVYAYGGPDDMALWRKHSVPGTRGPGRHAIHPGLRNRTTHA